MKGSELLKNNHFLCYIVGNTNSGKTHLCKYLIASLFSDKKFNNIFIFSPTAKISNDGSYSMVPDNHIFSNPTDDKIQKIIKLQKENSNLKTLIIFDDCIGVFSKESKVLNNLVISHRHLKISIIFISQYLKAINPVWRSNFHYLFSSKISNYENLKKYKEIWFNDVKDIQQHFNKYTTNINKPNEKHRFIFVDLFESPENKYKSIKAPQLDEFKIKFKA